MKTIEITLPDRLAESLINDKDREPSEVIIDALNRHLDPSYKFTDLNRWQTMMEHKIIDLQHQLDDHRNNCKSDIGKDFDNNLRQRNLNEKSPLELDEQDQPTRSLINEVTTLSSKPAIEQVSVDLGI